MIKYLSLFSGIGAFEKAMQNLRIPYDLVGYCEIDKHASKSYSLIHHVPESKNFGDITKIDETKLPKDIDFISYGFPCQDISIAGNLKGFEDEEGNKTRSGLFFDALRIITHTQPQFAIAENVKNLTSARFKKEFDIVLRSLEEAGYNNYWKVLDASDYGIPQHRERVFIVSIRKDVDHGLFRFPDPMELKTKMIDLLEDKVDDKYFLSEAMWDYCLGRGAKKTKFPRKERFLANINRPNQDVANTINVTPGTNPVDNFIKLRNGHVTFEDFTEETELKFLKIKEATKKGYTEAYEGDSVNLSYPNSTTRRGRVGHQVAQTLTTSPMMGGVVMKDDELMIRKLTPKECMRLTGFTDEDWQSLVDGKVSDTQIFHAAGNSIVVDVVECILCQIFDENDEIWL
jgi:DNA (cytosine-5)-methyltransferase 1